MARDTDTAVTLGSKHKRTERLALDKTGTPSVTNTAVLFKLFGYCSEKENLRLKLKNLPRTEGLRSGHGFWTLVRRLVL